MSGSASPSIAINTPVPASTMVDPATGVPTKPWWYVINRLVTRTGGTLGVDSAVLQAALAQAEADAMAAQATATLALLEDDDVHAVAMPQIRSLQTMWALSDEPESINVDSVVLLSLALSDETP